MVDASGFIEVAGPATKAIFGYDPIELEGQSVEILLPDEQRESHQAHRAAYAASPESRPMGVGRELYGRHRSGSVFPVDVSLVPTVIDNRPHFAAFVRNATERRRGEDILRFINEISRAVITSQPTAELLDATAQRAGVLVGAAAAWITVGVGDETVVAAAAGEASDRIAGATIPTGVSLASRAVQEFVTIEVADLAEEPGVVAEIRSAGFGPALFLPMEAEGGSMGTLTLARRRSEAPFDQEERRAAEVFASAAAIVLALGSARETLDHMRITSEHERIARDLHDTVIQRLFGLGMRLQAAERMADEQVAERIRSTVDAIDDVIREIRETIFDLNRPDGGEISTLRNRSRILIEEAARRLGFRPRIAFRGPVHSTVSDAIVPHLLAALDETLANVIQHAHASAVDVVVSVGGGRVTLSVADNGVGPAGTATPGTGLAAMWEQAAALGGECSVTRRDPVGTVVTFSVPLDAVG